MKKKIGVDLDSVLANFEDSAIRFHNDKHGTSLTLADHTDYDLSKIWKVSNEEVMRRVFEFYRSEKFDEILPVVGAVSGIDKLSKTYDLLVITSRPDWLKEKTVGWVEKYFSGKFSQIILTNQFSKNGSKMKKSEVCKREGAFCIIEDSTWYAEDCLENNIKVYLRDMPWNQKIEEHNDLMRFYEWTELENHL